MWTGASASYGKEPFDLRLTVLRMLRKLHIMVGIIVLGTILFGGGYYVKNVLLNRTVNYTTTSTYKVSYTDAAVGFGYYINTMTWETYVHTQEFLEGVWENLEKITGEHASFVTSTEELKNLFVVKLDSDVHIPSTVVTTGNPEWTMQLAEAVEQTMTEDFVENNEQITSIKVIDSADTPVEKRPDVRPFRAFVLSAVLSCFFVIVFFLLKEIGDDGIWLPATLRKRYGLPVAGTVESPELKVNLEHLLAGKRSIAICAVSEEMNPVEIAQMMQNISKDGEWIPIPAPLICPEACEKLRKADGVMLVVKAGCHAGKPLEYVLEYLTTQEINVAAVLLWEADEWLIRNYYRLEKRCDGRKVS
uniref:hypothetical protein n=1 Tax=Acetatifactor sp. TaxID=1872090 RepID=UPI0040566E8B